MSINVTPNLKLNVPDFDQLPWDTDVNMNWTVLDAAVGMFTAIPNLAGVWKNSTAYSYGTSVIDSSDSSIWQCVQTHTSSAAPQSFLMERVSYPARWTQTAAGAQFYATQAANSASAAQTAATNAANSAASAAGKLPLAGGTMTGFIVLNADPTGALHPTTKQYVDARVGGTGYLPTSGGTLTGQLTVPAIKYTNLTLADQHATSFGWNGSVLYYVIDGTWQGTIASQSYVNSNYLPISGGTITGNLTSNGGMFATSFNLSVGNGFFYADANYTHLRMDSGAWGLRYTRSTGLLQYIRGSDGVGLWGVDPSGNVAAGHDVSAANNVTAGANSYSRGGNVFWGAHDRAHLSSDDAYYTTINMMDNWQWVFTWSSGALAWYTTLGNPLFSIDYAGNVWCNGTYSFASDARLKSDITPAEHGLSEVLGLNPKTFIRTGGDRVELGFVAQDVQAVLPEAVHLINVPTRGSAPPTEPMLGLSIDPIVAALVNGMKEINTRLTALEAP